MERFAAALREAAGELDVPPRIRAEILLELAADLEAAFADGRAQGLDDDEAARRARERVLGPPGMVGRLARVHARAGGRGLEGLLDGLGDRLREGVGLVLLGVAVVPLLLAAGWVAARNLLAPAPEPLIWPLLAVAVGVVVVGGGEAVRLAAGRMPDRRRLAFLLLLSAVAPALGGLAAVLGIYGLAMEMSTGAGIDPVQAMERVARGGSMLVAGLLAGLVGALAWFGLKEGATRRAVRSVDALLSGEARADAARPDIIPLTERRKA